MKYTTEELSLPSNVSALAPAAAAASAVSATAATSVSTSTTLMLCESMSEACRAACRASSSVRPRLKEEYSTAGNGGEGGGEGGGGGGGGGDGEPPTDTGDAKELGERMTKLDGLHCSGVDRTTYAFFGLFGSMRSLVTKSPEGPGKKGRTAERSVC